MSYFWQLKAQNADRQAPQSVPCEDCNGTGEVGEAYGGSEFQPPERDRCDSCDGTGRWRTAIPSTGGSE